MKHCTGISKTKIIRIAVSVDVLLMEYVKWTLGEHIAIIIADVIVRKHELACFHSCFLYLIFVRTRPLRFWYE